MSKLSDYFDNNLPEEEIESVQRKLSELNDNPELEKNLQTLFDSIEINRQDDAEQAYYLLESKLFNKHTTRKTKHRLSYLALRIAAAMFIPVTLICGWLGYKVTDTNVELCEMTVPYGQTRQLVLSDGTTLHVNSGTKVIYPAEFKGKERKIFVDGEVVAEVAKNHRKPFIIKSGEISVKVLGTKFDLRSYNTDDNAEIILLEGSVNLSIESDNQAKDIKLVPGDLIQYDKVSGNVNIQKIAPESYKSFNENNALHFYNMTLSDIAKNLERVFGKRIVIMDNNLAQTRYFAYFTNNETLEQILSFINADKRIKVRNEGQTLYISPQ